MKESVLISQLKSIRGKWEPGPAIGVQSQSQWQGPAEVRLDDQTWRVAQCDSVLDICQTLSESGDSQLVVITPLSTQSVGDDVRARLFKGQVFGLDLWNVLAERFQARQVDAALRQAPGLASLALDVLGSVEAPVAASGTLTADLVWQVILERRLGLPGSRPDLIDFLPWVASEGAANRWDSLGGGVQQALQVWLRQSLGEMCDVLLRTLSDGYGPDAIAAGLALGALSGPRADPRALGRIERYTGGQPLRPDHARMWKDAAERWASGAGPEPARRELNRTDQLLVSLGAADAAIDSLWSPAGFLLRLGAFARELDSGDIRAAQRAYLEIAAHEGARHLEELRGRRERAEMAMRLLQWLESPSILAASLADSVAAFENDGSWADWARHQLSGGDEPESISRAYRRLFERATERREDENRRFAELLARATAAGSPPASVLMIEDVLTSVVVRLTHSSPAGVLFIVMDGMSVPVWRELSVDLTRHGWHEWTALEGGSHRTALTVLPPVTAYSRTSLLCGGLVSGTQSLEKSRFQAHPELRRLQAVLFHKDEVGSSGSSLGEAVRLAVGNADRKLVAVVVNVIDDSLDGPEQRSFRWTLQDIPVLQALLSEARSSGRAVVVASDHGHVLDHGSKLIRQTETADRWRPGKGAAPGGDELVVQGSRVLAEGGTVIAPVSERTRYTANPRLGYHGGLTSQECVAPLAVLAPGVMEIDGWEIFLESPPDWWFSEPVASTPAAPAAKRTRRKELTRAPLPLFDAAPAPPDWVAGVLRSAVFQDQMATFGGRVKIEQVETALRVLKDKNLVLLKSAFAQRMDLPGLRVDGFIASLQRVLNVESYPVLSVDTSQTVRLNLQLLRDQFALEETNVP